MYKLITIFLFVVIFVCACSNDKPDLPVVKRIEIKPDTDAFILDTLFIDRFFVRHAPVTKFREPMRSFYEKRDYSSAWINHAGLNEYAGNFINLLSHEQNQPATEGIYLMSDIHKMYSRIISARKLPPDSVMREMELLLTVNFFSYASRNWGGLDDSALKKVSWFVERKRLNYEELLSGYLANPRLLLNDEPVYRQYTFLKRELRKYDSIEKNGGWEELRETHLPLKPGATDSVIPAIKARLYSMGDLGYNDGTLLFDSSLADALAEFQERHGLLADGNIGKKTWEALRVPVRERVRQILINMERARWVPARVAGHYLAVNIPEFKLHVYNDDSLLWSCNVIVGKSEPVFHTVIFNEEMEYVVFSPYWNIPGNILSMEILPALRANPGYLQSHHLEVVDYKGRNIDASSINWKSYYDKFPYIIRERPGANNSLGRVKFLFPNPYEIYLHDTPARSLFKESSRAFSHGCIRVEEPFRLAQFVLGDDTGWTAEKIMQKMVAEKEEFVKIRKKIPVYLVYFTAFVDRSGRLNFRNDVYGHDEKMKNLLFVN